MWDEAVATCENLGENWHLLPLDNTLRLYFKKKNTIKE